LFKNTTKNVTLNSYWEEGKLLSRPTFEHLARLTALMYRDNWHSNNSVQRISNWKTQHTVDTRLCLVCYFSTVTKKHTEYRAPVKQDLLQATHHL